MTSQPSKVKTIHLQQTPPSSIPAMSLNMKSLTQALAKTAAVIEETVQTKVQDVTGPKPLEDYDLVTQIGSAGPGHVWKLYSANARDSTRSAQHYPTVCVWVLDKRAMSDARGRAGLSKAAEDSFLDLIRNDAGRLVRLRHPGIVHVVQGLDESKNAMAFVTEPLFASVGNVLGRVQNLGSVPKELNGMEMGLLEVKHGLLQIAESLDFLHNNARLIHRAISPENVLITANGSWKLGGFGFALSADQATDDKANVSAFHYAEYDVEDSILPLQPSLNYTAPELVRSRSPSAGYYSDVFSFGCLAYHLIARKPLFDCHNNVKMYMNMLNYLSSESFSSIPSELVPDLQRMLSTNESFRPTAMEFTGSPFFRNDTRLRALRFLDHMPERDNMQKSEFLKALSDMWKDFDSRILRYKVLPPLCAELRNSLMQPMILPMVLTIAESQDKNDFELSTLPALVPVLSTAAGETLLLLVKHTELIMNKASKEHAVSHVLPLLVRAYGDTDACIQEEALKKSAFVAKQLDIQLVKQVILPRVHGLALKTTVPAVRVNALLCLGELVHKLDKHAMLDILQTIQRCTAVDRSAPTLMCTLGVASAILKQHGVEFVAEHVLPLLAPLLTAQQLNVQQFAKYMLFVKDISRKIEEKRGVTVADTGSLEVKPSVSVNGLLSQAVSKRNETVASATNNRPAWDEDWGPSKGNNTSSKTSVPIKSPQSTSQPIQVMPQPQSSLSAISPDQVAVTCAPVVIEWPSRGSSGLAPQHSDSDKQLSVDGSATTILLGFVGVCMISSAWRDQQRPSFINFISSFLSENSIRLNYVSISPDIIFNCAGISLAFVFVTQWVSDNLAMFSRVQKLKEKFANLYVVITLSTKEQNDSFVRSYFKYSLEFGNPTFVPVLDPAMGFESIVKIAHSRGVCKQQDAKSRMEDERKRSVQDFDAFLRVVTSIPGINDHDAIALNQAIGSIEAIAKAPKEFIIENTDLSAEKAEKITRFFRDPKFYMSPKVDQ